MAQASTPRDFDDLWDFGDPAGTETKFRERLSSDASNDAEYRAELLTQIARTQGLQQQFDAAHATLDEVETLLTESTPTVHVRYLLERGRVFNSSQRRERATPLFQEAWDRARQHDLDFYAVDAAHMMEIVAAPEDKLAWNLRAAEVAEESDDERARKWLGSLYNNRGWSYHDSGDLAAAEKMFERTREFFQERGGPASRINVAWWCIAKMKRLQGDARGGLEIQERLLDSADDGFTREELGECLLALNRADEARPHFARAFELLSEDRWIARDEPERLERLERLSKAPESSK